MHRHRRLSLLVASLVALTAVATSQDFWESAKGGAQDSLAATWIQAMIITPACSVVVAGDHGVFLSSDNGSSWMAASGSIAGASVNAFAVDPSEKIWAAAGDSGVYVSSTNGKSWTSVNVPSDYYSGVVVSKSGVVFVSGVSSILRSSDAGKHWTVAPSVTPGPMFASQLSGVIYVMDGINTLSASSDNGTTWASVSRNVPFSSASSIVEDSTGTLYAGAWEGVFMSHNAGANWLRIGTHCSAALSVNAAGYLFTGEYGGIDQAGSVGPLMSKTAGQSWHDFTTGLGAHIGVTCYAMAADGRMFAGTVDGGVYRTVGSTLPVVLSGLSGNWNGTHGVMLHWATSDENGLSGFYIERSTSNTTGFSPLAYGFVASQGTVNAVTEYSFVDSSAAAGVQYFYRLREMGVESDYAYTKSVRVSVVNAVAEKNTASHFTLEQNFPNPFNPTTTISYSIPTSSHVVLEVFDAVGRRVATLADGHQEAGKHLVSFRGENLASGVYVYRIVAGQWSEVKRMMLVK